MDKQSVSLGDFIFAQIENNGVIIYTLNQKGVVDKIYLQAAVCMSLVNYLANLGFYPDAKGYPPLEKK